jgi:hypothetical protein
VSVCPNTVNVNVEAEVIVCLAVPRPDAATPPPPGDHLRPPFDFEQSVPLDSPIPRGLTCRRGSRKNLTRIRAAGRHYRLRRTRLATEMTHRYVNSTAAGGPSAVAMSAIYVSTGLTSGASHCGCCHPNHRPYVH